MYSAATQYILGVQPTYDGLRIAPCIPAAWDGFTVARHFRNARYQIVVRNPDHVCRGVASMSVDGKSIRGNVVPIFEDGREHRVDVTLG